MHNYVAKKATYRTLDGRDCVVRDNDNGTGEDDGGTRVCVFFSFLRKASKKEGVMKEKR